jgi:adenine-specific DNA-methyltransferase
MIDKEDAKNKGFQIIETSNHLKNQKQNLIAELKKLLPELISEDTLNIETLKNLLSTNLESENLTDSKLGYELNFVGKAVARAEADEDTKYVVSLNQTQSKNLATTDNIVIKGDNLDALKILKQNYQNKIKMIYIDPPYNTGSDNFIYNDYFKQKQDELIEKYNLTNDTLKYYENVYASKTHSGWLAFMYPRLKLARDLLKDDGCIFISIDDNEQANLKIIMDEIFGEENFVTNFLWEKSSANLSKFYKNNYDYILCYIKNKEVFEDKFIGRISDGMGDSSLLNGKANIYSNLIFPPNSIAFKFTDQTYINKFKEEDLELHNDIEIINNTNKNEVIISAHFKWKQDTLIQEIESGTSIIAKTNSLRLRYQRDNKGDIIIPYKSITRENNVSLKNNEDVLGFNNAKPVDLIMYLLSMINTQNHDIILDFFAGSGTTGQAVMELNKKDGGNRKFILVQKNEEIKEKNEAYKFCEANNFEKVISSITIERLNRAGDKIKEENPLIENLDIGYKVFDLVEKPSLNIKNNNTELFIENNYKSSINAFYAMLTKTDKLLSTKFQELTKNIFLIINDTATNPENTIESNTTELNNIELYITDIQDKEDKDILQHYQNQYNTLQIYLNGFANISLATHLTYFNKKNTTIIF